MLCGNPFNCHDSNTIYVDLYLTVEKVTDSLHRSFTLVPSFGLAANDKRREEVCFTYEPLLAVLFCRVLQCPDLRPLPFLRRKGFSFWRGAIVLKKETTQSVRL